MTEFDFNTPQRQSLLGIVVYLLRNGQAIFSSLIILFAVGNDNPVVFASIVAGIVLLVIILGYISYLQYRNFTFHVKNRELIIHKGVLVKDKKTIPLSRIQSVQIEQNIIQQLLGVVGLKIDSAGSSGKELEIPALESHIAESFRDLLRTTESFTEAEPGMPETSEKEVELVSLSPKDLLKVGLTENHIRNGMVAVLVVYGYATQYLNYVEDYVEELLGTYINDLPSQLIRVSLVFIVAGIVIFILISVLISLGRTVLKFYDFKASIAGEVVNIKSGLLKKNEFRIPVHKIQYLKWESNPIRKKLGFNTTRIYQVESGKESKKRRVEIPACYAHQTEALEKLVYGQIIGSSNGEAIYADAAAYTRFYSILLGVPCLVLSAVLYFVYPLLFYSPLLLIPFIIFFSYNYGKSIHLEFMEDVLVINKGWIFPSRTVISYYKAQAMRYSDNIFLRKQSLAHLVIHTASGSVKTRYLSDKTVHLGIDLFLYKTEKFKGNWM